MSFKAGTDFINSFKPFLSKFNRAYSCIGLYAYVVKNGSLFSAS